MWQRLSKGRLSHHRRTTVPQQPRPAHDHPRPSRPQTTAERSEPDSQPEGPRSRPASDRIGLRGRGRRRRSGNGRQAVDESAIEESRFQCASRSRSRTSSASPCCPGPVAEADCWTADLRAARSVLTRHSREPFVRGGVRSRHSHSREPLEAVAVLVFAGAAIRATAVTSGIPRGARSAAEGRHSAHQPLCEADRGHALLLRRCGGPSPTWRAWRPALSPPGVEPRVEQGQQRPGRAPACVPLAGRAASATGAGTASVADRGVSRSATFGPPCPTCDRVPERRAHGNWYAWYDRLEVAGPGA
jgi:hypothetical protein